MLPDDARDRRLAAAAQTKKTFVNSHFQKLKPGEKEVPYSDELFKEAAIHTMVDRNGSGALSLSLVSQCI